MILEQWLLTTKKTGNTAYLWGNSAQFGELGLSDTASRSNPTPIDNFWRKISVGADHTLGIDKDGYLYAWGSNFYGQLGNSESILHSSSRSSPVLIGTNKWIDISTHGFTSYAIRDDFKLFSWGRGDYGQLGTATDIHDTALGPYHSWTTAASAADYAGMIRSDGKLFVTFTPANSGLGNSGDGSSILRSSPVQIGTSSWTMIAVADPFAAAIRSDGALFTWGGGTLGRLGTNDAISRSSPVQIGTSSWIMVSVNHESSAAIRSDGGLFVWGNGADGNLGTNDTIIRSSPVQIGTSSWTAVSVGVRYMLAIRSDGALFVWGQGTAGRLGINDTITRSSPVQLGTSSWTAVALSPSHAAAIRSDGALFVWGAGTTGRLGTNDTISRSSPIQLGTSSWTTLALGSAGGFAIKTDGTLWSWGTSIENALASPGLYTTPATVSSPVQIGSSSWVAVYSNIGTVARGTLTTNIIAKRQDGSLWTWGITASLPINDRISVYSPVLIGDVLARSPNQIGTSSWLSVNSGPHHVTAIRSDRLLFAWGRNSTGELGVDDTTNRNSPTSIGTASWNSISAGGRHTVGIRDNFTLHSWGENRYGKLGTNDTINRSSPVQIGTSSWISVSAGARHTVAVRSDNFLYGFGFNAFSNDLSQYSWNVVSSDGIAAFAIRSDGALFVWGSNEDGKLGTNDTLLRTSPVQLGTSSWTFVSAGVRQLILPVTAAIRSDGALFIWGRGQNGPLGTNDTINRSSPVQLGTSSWTAVSVGQSHVAAIRSDGALFVWGAGVNGSLGTNDTITRSSPVQLGTSSWTAVSAGSSSTSAIRSDGALFIWGAGGFGRLGTNDTISRSSPIQLGTSSWTSVAVTSSRAAAIRSDGALFIWGDNTDGVLGLNDTLNRSSPVQLGTSSWTFISLKTSSFYAIRIDGALFSSGYAYGNFVGYDGDILRSSPVQIGTSSWGFVGAKQPIAGGTINLGISSTRGLYVWNEIIGSDQFNRSIVEVYDDEMYKIPYRWNDTLSIVPSYHPSVIEEHKSSPTQIGSLTWNNAIAGDNYNFAINSSNALFIWGVESGPHNNVSTPTSTLAAINIADIGHKHSTALQT